MYRGELRDSNSTQLLRETEILVMQILLRNEINELKKEIKEYLDEKLEKQKEYFDKKLEEQKKEFNDRFDDLESKILELEHQLDDQKRFISAFVKRGHTVRPKSNKGLNLVPAGISGPAYDPTGKYYWGL